MNGSMEAQLRASEARSAHARGEHVRRHAGCPVCDDLLRARDEAIAHERALRSVPMSLTADEVRRLDGSDGEEAARLVRVGVDRLARAEAMLRAAGPSCPRCGCGSDPVHVGACLNGSCPWERPTSARVLACILRNPGVSASEIEEEVLVRVSSSMGLLSSLLLVEQRDSAWYPLDRRL